MSYRDQIDRYVFRISAALFALALAMIAIGEDFKGFAP